MRRLLVLTMAALLSSGCRDPVLEAKADALGPDPGPYEEGEKHRAGFPCTHCHASGGRAKPHYDLAGTVYADKDATEGMEGVTVRLFDASGRQQAVTTNSVGTFFFEEDQLALDFPLWVRIELGDEVRSMQNPIFRERSCATCHRNPSMPSRRWQVHLRGDP